MHLSQPNNKIFRAFSILKILVFHRPEKLQVSVRFGKTMGANFSKFSTAYLECFASPLKLNSVQAETTNLPFSFFVSRNTKPSYSTELFLGVSCLKHLFDARISVTPFRLIRTTTKLLEGHSRWFTDN